MTQDDITRALDRMAYQVWENNAGTDLALIGIHSRGIPIAQRMQKLLSKIAQKEIPTGILDTGLYRDDIGRTNITPALRNTEIDFDLDCHNIVLVDDVLFTGRTVRAALNALIDMGRPRKVELLVLVDRGHRELPIQADYAGGTFKTDVNETIQVCLKETDSEEGVYAAPSGRE